MGEARADWHIYSHFATLVLLGIVSVFSDVDLYKTGFVLRIIVF